MEKSAIREAVQAILGDSPKSSLLFGAPAISLRQLESNLELPSGTLRAQDVLVPASQIALQTFKGKRQAQVKNLRRSGETEEWIVFRPNLPGGGSAFPTPPTKLGDVKVPVSPTLIRTRSDQTTQNHHSKADDKITEIVRDISLLPQAQNDTINTKRKFFRPFFKSTTSQLSAYISSSDATTFSDQALTLPPAHKIGSADFDTLNLVPKVDATFRVQKSPPVPAGRSKPNNPFTNIPKSHTEQTYIPVNIDRKHPRLEVEVEENLPLRPRPRLPPPPSRPIAQNTGESIKVDTESSLPYLKISPNMANPADIHLPKTEISDEPNIADLMFVPRDLDAEEQIVPDPSRLVISLSPTLSNPTSLDTPSTPHTSIAIPSSPPTSPILLSPISPISPLPLTASSAPNPSSLSPTFDRPITPWLNVVFQDLPFGPDVPAFQILEWGCNRWQLLCAEMVIILGAVYIIQFLGI